MGLCFSSFYKELRNLYNRCGVLCTTPTKQFEEIMWSGQGKVEVPKCIIEKGTTLYTGIAVLF